MCVGQLDKRTGCPTSWVSPNGFILCGQSPDESEQSLEVLSSSVVMGWKSDMVWNCCEAWGGGGGHSRAKKGLPP